MTLALTKVTAYGIEASEPLQKRFKQVLILEGTGATTNLTHDYGTYAGTFWTAVGSTAPGISALKAVKDIQIKAKCFDWVGGKGISGYVGQVAVAPGTLEVKVLVDATNTKIPNLLFFTNEGPTAWAVVIQWTLNDGEIPEELYATA